MQTATADTQESLRLDSVKVTLQWKLFLSLYNQMRSKATGIMPVAFCIYSEPVCSISAFLSDKKSVYNRKHLKRMSFSRREGGNDMGRVGRFILKVAAVLILIVSAGTFALSLFTGETRNGDNLQSEFDYLITVGISQSGEESSWKDANTASFMDTFVKSNGYEAVYADAGSDQENRLKMWKDL